jgi:hypothetical protein
MNEKELIRKLYDCAARDDHDGAAEALAQISDETVNSCDGDGYDMLIDAVMNGNVCLVEVLLESGRCDLDREESLCGLTALEYSRMCPDNSRIRKAFENLRG